MQPTPDFELALAAKKLLREGRSGALATLMQGSCDPYCSLVNVATAADGAPLLLISRLAVHTVGTQRHLPAEPRSRVNPKILQRKSEETGGHLLAGGDNDVIFARIMNAARLPRPLDELVGDPGHRGDDDSHLVSGIDFVSDPPSNVLDVGDIG